MLGLVLRRTGSVIFLSTCFLFWENFSLPHLLTVLRRLQNLNPKERLSYHLCVECFSQLSFDSEVYTKSATAADFVYISE